MQKIHGNPTVAKRTVSPTTSTASTSSNSSISSSSSSSSSTDSLTLSSKKLSRSPLSGMSATTVPITKNSSQFDINSLMMAAAAVAANTQQQQQQQQAKSGKTKQLNEIYKTNEYYEYLNKNELANSNSNKHVDDESDSNYLNKLKRHKFNEAKHMDMLNTSNEEINENDLLVAAKFNPNQQQQQSGAKKRKRQFTSSQQQQPVYESDEADGEQVDNQEEITTLAQRKHLKLMNEQTTPVKSVSRRKSKTHNFYSNHDHSNGDLDDETGRDINEENEEDDEEDDDDDMDDEEDRYVKSRGYNNEEGDNDEDMEVGQITINASLINQSKEEDDDEDELNDDSDNELVQSGGALEVGELIRKSQSEYEEDLNEKENGNDEDEEEDNQYDDEPILLNDHNQIKNMHTNGLLAQLHHGEASKASSRHGDFLKQQQQQQQLQSNKQINNGMQNKQQQQLSNRFVAQNDYSQNALIASTLANLAAAANLNSNGQLQGSNGNLNASSNSSSASKIFHVDAYCYLCKKEFCNKYFLRTHLANKHKVFLNSNDLSTLSGASMSKLQNDLLEEQQKNKFNRKNKSQQQRVGAPNGASNVRSSSASSSGSTHSSASSSTSNSPVPQQHAQSNLTIANVLYTQQNGGKNSVNKLTNQASSASSMSSEEIISNAYMKLNGDAASSGNAASTAVEDFCELCNKQFCNKYYLKKHKFDVHGILVENNIKSYKKIDEPSLLQQQQSNFMNSQSGRSTVNGLINGANSSPLKPSSNSFNNNSFNNNGNSLQASLFPNSSQSHSLALAAAAAAAGNLSNMMFVNPYMSPMMQLPHVMPVNSTASVSSANNTSQNQQAANVNQNVSSSPSSSSSSSSCSSSSASPPNMAMDMLNRLSNGHAPSNTDMSKTKLNKSESNVSLKNMDGVEVEAGAAKVQRLPAKEADKKAPSSTSSTSSSSSAPNGAVSVACDLIAQDQQAQAACRQLHLV